MIGVNLSVEPEPDRRTHILGAAERAFARHGFHAATMNDVAAEARMSPGNLYRYFPSKDAIVAGLCERDQAEMAHDFTGLAGSGDLFAAIGQMLRKRLVGLPRERIQLVMEIWAESSRNPVIAAIRGEIDALVRSRLLALVAAAKRDGLAAADLDDDMAVRAMLTTGFGLFKRRAHEPDFDGEAEIALALGLFTAVFRGEVRPYRGGMR